jgi:hypothetical protein
MDELEKQRDATLAIAQKARAGRGSIQSALAAKADLATIPGQIVNKLAAQAVADY